MIGLKSLDNYDNDTNSTFTTGSNNEHSKRVQNKNFDQSQTSSSHQLQQSSAPVRVPGIAAIISTSSSIAGIGASSQAPISVPISSSQQPIRSVVHSSRKLSQYNACSNSRSTNRRSSRSNISISSTSSNSGGGKGKRRGRVSFGHSNKINTCSVESGPDISAVNNFIERVGKLRVREVLTGRELGSEDTDTTTTTNTDTDTANITTCSVVKGQVQSSASLSDYTGILDKSERVHCANNIASNINIAPNIPHSTCSAANQQRRGAAAGIRLQPSTRNRKGNNKRIQQRSRRRQQPQSRAIMEKCPASQLYRYNAAQRNWEVLHRPLSTLNQVADANYLSTLIATTQQPHFQLAVSASTGSFSNYFESLGCQPSGRTSAAVANLAPLEQLLASNCAGEQYYSLMQAFNSQEHVSCLHNSNMQMNGEESSAVCQQISKATNGHTKESKNSFNNSQCCSNHTMMLAPKLNFEPLMPKWDTSTCSVTGGNNNKENHRVDAHNAGRDLPEVANLDARMDSSYFSLSTDGGDSCSSSSLSCPTREDENSRSSPHKFSFKQLMGKEDGLRVHDQIDRWEEKDDWYESGSCSDCDSSGNSGGCEHTMNVIEDETMDLNGQQGQGAEDASEDNGRSSSSESIPTEDCRESDLERGGENDKENFVCQGVGERGGYFGGVDVPLTDVSSRYDCTSHSVSQYSEFTNHQNSKTSRADLRCEATHSVTVMPPIHSQSMGVAADKHNLRLSKEPSCLNMTPDTFAATRQIVADSPMTPCDAGRGGSSFLADALKCPIPELSWGDNRVCWEDMITNDDIQHRIVRDVLANQTRLTAQHRAVVLEWLSEVTHNFHMRKDTFYLAVNLFDRFLAVTSSISPDKLQLLGTTALFTAAKIEEIYPPPLREFAVVTDGACSACDIKDTELCLVQHLKWKLSPVTALQWLLLFLQIKLCSHQPTTALQAVRALSAGNKVPANNLIAHPKFEPWLYHQASALLDLCMLSVHSTQFPPRMLAAAALMLFDQSFQSLFSFLDRKQLARCMDWMYWFARVSLECLEREEAKEYFGQESALKDVVSHHHLCTMEALKKAELSFSVSHSNPSHTFSLQSAQSSASYRQLLSDGEEDDAEFTVDPERELSLVLFSPP